MPLDEEHGDEHMPQEMFDLFTAVDNGDGTQDEAAHDALRALHEAGVGKGDL